LYARFYTRNYELVYDIPDSGAEYSICYNILHQNTQSAITECSNISSNSGIECGTECGTECGNISYNSSVECGMYVVTHPAILVCGNISCNSGM
jgi:hypothetical protein